MNQMRNGNLGSESFGPCLLLSVPDDVIAIIARFVSPRDICNLSLCCKSLCEVVDSENIWFVQCDVAKVLPLSEIVQWRVEVSCYKALCRFLVDVVKPLVGIWVHQNPELGNVVYVMPGFLSVVGCRIIPQEVGPLGIEEACVMWSPVFEVICGSDGSAKFFLHGRDGKLNCCVHPGFVVGIEKSCNVLLLEVEPRREETVLLGETEVRFPFRSLPFSYRRNLLHIVTSTVGIPVPDLSSERLFPTSKDDEAVLLERRTMLLKMHKFGGDWNHMNLEDECISIANQVDINKSWKELGFDVDIRNMDAGNQIQGTQKKSLSRYFRSGIKQILGRSSSSKKTSSSRSETRPWNLQRFLSFGDSLGLSLKASKIKLSSYQGWPNMDETCFALYKLPVKNPIASEEYAGLWGGTFGWPPGTCTEDKPGKALFLLMLSYEQSQDGTDRLLIGTKILEGTHYGMHPNGSAMFVIKIDSPSFELFPFETNGEEFENSYEGEGTAKGYGFRYPGYKPGTLFVTSKGLLMFVWKATKVVMTLQRLDLGDLLRKGMCVPPLPPCLNFAYLTKCHANVFAPERRRS
ncbi:PREDICTED: F-box protein At5g39450 [Camelina sativa]|uniref:F-box protein At5g39450 n=1 Tax=Camelina sativa TaxID=90675 RepID=A0ABM0UH40_CAMSA|nr:PREDICTED: F-box protein At5g39450 [Camelina sativa]